MGFGLSEIVLTCSNQNGLHGLWRTNENPGKWVGKIGMSRKRMFDCTCPKFLFKFSTLVCG
jgi:hypothetical protein